MKSAELHPRERERVAALLSLEILDTLPEKEFDELTQIAAQICTAPIALISLVDGDRLWFKSKIGFEAEETPREIAFCAHAILQDGVMEIKDLTKDERFTDNPLAREAKVVFYAGAPLRSPDNLPIGTICVMDNKPRELSAGQIKALESLANQVNRLLVLRTHISQVSEAHQKLSLQKVAIDGMSEGFVLRSADGKIVDCNPSAFRILGLEASKVKGRGYAERAENLRPDETVLPPEELSWRRAMATGQSQNGIKGVRAPGGEIAWLRSSATPLFTEGSKTPTHTITILSEITEQMVSRKLLEATRLEMARVLDGVPARIAHVDRNLINISSNTAYAAHWGKTPEEIKGKHITEFVSPQLYEKFKAHLENVLRGIPQSFEWDSVVDVKITPVVTKYTPDKVGETVEGCFISVTDISQIKELELQRRQLEAKLIASAKMLSLGEMAGGVAHEINTPLGVIQMITENLRDQIRAGEFAPQAFLNKLQRVEKTVDHIAKIVRGLRLFSRDSEDDPMTPVLIQEIVDETLALVKERFLGNNVELRLLPIPAIMIPCRSTQISQILMNLLSNAFDAVENLDEKWVELGATVSAETIKIWVTDSGPGIPAPIVEKLMQPFFTTKEIGRGTGLGLSISLGIALGHSGTLKYDGSSPHTRFVLELPLKQPIPSL